jgi:Uma2 family endonuclease
MSVLTASEPVIREQTSSELVTVEQLLAMPEDGIDRDLIRGQLKERPMTRRSRRHAKTEARVNHLLQVWLDRRPHPRGDVFSGEVGCILRRDPDTTVGIDVAYITAEHAAQQTDATRLIEGPPLLAVEILSPSDTHEDVAARVDEYLACGVALVWIVDTHFQTVTVHRRNSPPELCNVTQTLAADPELPGFSVAVKDLFE